MQLVTFQYTPTGRDAMPEWEEAMEGWGDTPDRTVSELTDDELQEELARTSEAEWYGGEIREELARRQQGGI